MVITGSPTGMLGVTPASIAYSSSKGGVHGMARVMAADYAQEGIRVNVVVPGFTLSPLVRELVADPKVYEWNVKNIPMRRGARAGRDRRRDRVPRLRRCILHDRIVHRGRRGADRRLNPANVAGAARFRPRWDDNQRHMGGN